MFFDPLSNDPSASSTTPTKAFRASSKPSTVSPELKNSELVGTMYSLRLLELNDTTLARAPLVLPTTIDPGSTVSYTHLTLPTNREV